MRNTHLRTQLLQSYLVYMTVREQRHPRRKQSTPADGRGSSTSSLTSDVLIDQPQPGTPIGGLQDLA